MPDQVPTTGLWQTDPEVRRLLAAASSAGMAARGSQSPTQTHAWQALQRYIDANRTRLGIPDNYWPDPRTNGQTLYDPNQNQLRDAAITGGALAGGGYALGGLLPSGAAATGNASVIPGTGIPTVAGTGAGVTAPAVAAGASATASVVDRIRNSLTDPSTYASLAPLLASLAAGGFGGAGGGAGSGNDELRRIQGITEARMRRVDPLHQVATQLAYSRAPIKARQGTALADIRLPE
jgi:hypothetical protein